MSFMQILSTVTVGEAAAIGLLVVLLVRRK